jgi:ferric-dicitrate binding protein FerR (iron transport regulator)
MIDELLISYLLNEGDADKRRLVENWVTANTGNQRYFEHFRLIWENSQQVILPNEIDEQAAWRRFRQRAATREKKPHLVRQMSDGFLRFRAAAGIILVLGALTIAYLVWDNTSSGPVVFASGTASRADTLPDGSVVTLNKNSEITYATRLRGNERKIGLKGEAFFQVTPDKQKPFVVTVNDMTITVVGTAFNVKSTDEGTEVIVESGVVKINRHNKERVLTRGQKLSTGTRDSLNVQPNVDKLYNYYRTKEFICDNTPLWKLVTILNEAYDANIVVENKSLNQLPLTTTFSNESLENVLHVIGETFGITIERRGDAIILK